MRMYVHIHVVYQRWRWWMWRVISGAGRMFGEILANWIHQSASAVDRKKNNIVWKFRCPCYTWKALLHVVHVLFHIARYMYYYSYMYVHTYTSSRTSTIFQKTWIENVQNDWSVHTCSNTRTVITRTCKFISCTSMPGIRWSISSTERHIWCLVSDRYYYSTGCAQLEICGIMGSYI